MEEKEIENHLEKVFSGFKEYEIITLLYVTRL